VSIALPLVTRRSSSGPPPSVDRGSENATTWGWGLRFINVVTIQLCYSFSDNKHHAFGTKTPASANQTQHVRAMVQKSSNTCVRMSCPFDNQGINASVSAIQPPLSLVVSPTPWNMFSFYFLCSLCHVPCSMFHVPCAFLDVILSHVPYALYPLPFCLFPFPCSIYHIPYTQTLTPWFHGSDPQIQKWSKNRWKRQNPNDS
jgi:hypothetical protein